MNQNYTGGCACGKIRYSIKENPIFMNDCQCRDCQKMSGSGHGSYISFGSKKGVVIEGKASNFEMVGDSGNTKTSSFCPNCGSPVYMSFSAMPDLFTIHVASLDDPNLYKPQAITYTKRGFPWDFLNPNLPKFETMPSS